MLIIVVNWNCIQRVGRCRNYLDDFITMRPLGPQVCGRNLYIISRACKELGVPLAMKKSESPNTHLIFLGVEIDTTSGSMRNHKKS